MYKLKHFLTTLDYTQEELNSIIEEAILMKNGKLKKSVSGKILGMLFFNPSLRTRLSFSVGMYKLGGMAIDLPVNSAYPFELKENAVMDGKTIEHVKDAARIISRQCDVIGVRASELITSSEKSVSVSAWDVLKRDAVISAFAKFATVPVINMESNVWHPCQGLGDAMTIVEKVKNPKGKRYVLTWAYHPKALPMATPNSEILAACDLGMEVVVAHPKGWELDREIMQKIEKRAQDAGGDVRYMNNQEEAFEGADVVCAKSWGALKYYGNWEEEKKKRDKFKYWMVDRRKMELTNDAFFMHCLPVRRNVKVTDEVLDSPNSLIVDQAENRMWAQMALLTKIL